MTIAALYARVSSERQKEEQPIASQVAALREHAGSAGYEVAEEWIFQEEGYSGATLVRPALEPLRDLVADGAVDAVLVHAPDWLSRRYAYQLLLVEEFARHGTEVVFVNAPAGDTPEAQLVVPFQGMIAEYERALIRERTRRGKRHRARNGSINVLGGAPCGYRYVRKTDTSAAYYEVVTEQAAVVHEVFRLYTQEAFSIAAITRWLNQHQVPPIRARAGGNDPPYGRCCAIRRTRARPVLARPSAHPGRGSRDRGARRGTMPHRAAPIARPHAIPGSRSRCRSWWTGRPSPGRRNAWATTSASARETRWRRRSCRVCWSVSNVATPTIVRRRGPRNARSSITAAWDRIDTAGRRGASVQADRCARTISTTSSGNRWCACSKNPG